MNDISQIKLWGYRQYFSQENLSGTSLLQFYTTLGDH